MRMIGDRTEMGRTAVLVGGVPASPELLGCRVRLTTPDGVTRYGAIRWWNHIYLGVQADGETVARGALPSAVMLEKIVS